ncbi:hypothetical protein F4680DRAFT_470724 [Xylaria scruposa]|nr:hypothetical protein F4680DRAFT_470724 [Xylaria scruposa]
MDTMSYTSTTLVEPSKTEILIHKTCDVHGYCRGPSLGHTYYISVRDAIIIGSVLGGVVIIALLVLAIHCWRRREMKKPRDRKGKQVMTENLRADPYA